MWSKPLLCRFRQSGETPQMQVPQGFAAFHFALPRIPPRHTQIKRATNCAIPGYLILNHYRTKFVRLKDFLSVVIPVVKAAFMPLSAIRGNPANAGITRLCGVSPCPVPDTATAHPNVAPYQLSYTRLFRYFIRLHVFTQPSVIPTSLYPEIQFLPLYHSAGKNQRFSCLLSILWSKPLLCRFQQPGGIPQTQVLQGFPGFCSNGAWTGSAHSQSGGNHGWCGLRRGEGSGRVGRGNRGRSKSVPGREGPVRDAL